MIKEFKIFPYSELYYPATEITGVSESLKFLLIYFNSSKTEVLKGLWEENLAPSCYECTAIISVQSSMSLLVHNPGAWFNNILLKCNNNITKRD